MTADHPTSSSSTTGDPLGGEQRTRIASDQLATALRDPPKVKPLDDDQLTNKDHAPVKLDNGWDFVAATAVKTAGAVPIAAGGGAAAAAAGGGTVMAAASARGAASVTGSAAGGLRTAAAAGDGKSENLSSRQVPVPIWFQAEVVASGGSGSATLY